MIIYDYKGNVWLVRASYISDVFQYVDSLSVDILDIDNDIYIDKDDDLICETLLQKFDHALRKINPTLFDQVVK